MVDFITVVDCEYLLNEKRGTDYCCFSAEPSLVSKCRTSFPDAKSDGKTSVIDPKGFKVDG